MDTFMELPVGFRRSQSESSATGNAVSCLSRFSIQWILIHAPLIKGSMGPNARKALISLMISRAMYTVKFLLHRDFIKSKLIRF